MNTRMGSDMHALDATMVCAYFALMVVIGWWSRHRVADGGNVGGVHECRHEKTDAVW